MASGAVKGTRGVFVRPSGGARREERLDSDFTWDSDRDWNRTPRQGSTDSPPQTVHGLWPLTHTHPHHHRKDGTEGDVQTSCGAHVGKVFTKY